MGHRHSEHLQAPGIVVIPDTNDRVLAFLCRSNHVPALRNIKAADGCRMSEEEPLLVVSLNIHGNQGATRGEEDDVLVGDARPLQAEALGGRVTNDVSQLHDRVLIELWVDLALLANVHTGSVSV